MPKRAVTGGMRVKVYPVLERAVEEGFRRGWHRAHKHTETPTPQAIEDEVTSAIMGDICEVFDIDE
jgi:hypothetical protein